MKKRIFRILPVIIVIVMAACQNQEQVFPDYAYTTSYFPYQTPVRTLILGDYDLADNSKDNKLQFSIGVVMGGVFDNKKDRKVGYIVDTNLVKNLYDATGERIQVLSPENYTLSPSGTMTIPAGSLNGFIDVQLKDAFLNDTLAIKNHYVIPLVLTTSETDSILKGKTDRVGADRRIASHWTVQPKDYTLFGIKFINPFHGKYLNRGVDVIKKADGTLVSTIPYSTKFIEDNEIRYLQTRNRNQVLLIGAVRRTAGSPGNFRALLTFDGNNNCVITKDPSSTYNVTGTGKFIQNGDEWGGQKRNQIIINYQITDAVNAEFHTATDTLVIRDRDVRLETFVPVVR